MRQPHIVLIPGYWLGAWAWDEVIEKLTSAGALATALTLPGLDPRDPQRAARTLDDQAEAIAGVLGQLGGDVVLVGHSGANGPVSVVLDRHPELIRRVIWVDSGPMANDGAFAPDLPAAVLELTNAARHDVATTLICCSLPSAQVLELAAQGHPMFSAVAQLTQLDVVDLPTGHWPMWSRPQELANAIHTAASLIDSRSPGLS